MLCLLTPLTISIDLLIAWKSEIFVISWFFSRAFLYSQSKTKIALASILIYFIVDYVKKELNIFIQVPHKEWTFYDINNLD